ncbi:MULTISPECIES: glycosyltransferase family 2 protein [Aeromonas]|uniref:Glycosyltransferase 2-like domain-containing protein n=1 Tax=Aeromonas caviae TaxID=648 RepID=A0A6S4TM84_AERCA|nr:MULTISPECIES: glycosyltransferase [Aeromonas]MBM0439833.1 glycosyltransferase [Aeromonas hydrophila subsp. ranae]MBW3830324.1 glycosyltransferase [Aeromonas hydrophila]MDK3165087.1 glycosyltransferase [Aeromonas caviae]BBQ29989.1 hypothetical protein WP2W18E01_15710 [Aeromonas caviae]BCK62521.1 hypothetical protein KAM330_15100 [Aeromonas hydrophila]
MVCKKVVAVVVITYNSAKTVVETLNSIVSQTYGADFIELIISDDASVDNTTNVIEDWLEQHGSSFYSVMFFKNTVNLGVSGNVNVAWKTTTSEWVKTIAGDDILFPGCICDNINYIKKAKDTCAVFSEMELFKVDGSGENNIISTSPSEIIKSFFNLPAAEQFKKLCIGNFVPAPSSFININVLKNVGFADERFKLIEDYPLWLKLTSSGYKLNFLDKKTVYYRISDSLSSNVTRLVNFNFFSSLNDVYAACVYPKLKHNRTLLLQIKLTRMLTFFVAKIFKNEKNGLSVFMMRLIYLMSPKHVKSWGLIKDKIRSTLLFRGV